MKRFVGVWGMVVAGLGIAIGVAARADQPAARADEPAERELMKTEKQIQANLQSDRDLANNRIDVQVSDGVATLKGTVDSEAERGRAVRLAGIAGVRIVDDQLKVESVGAQGDRLGQRGHHEDQGAVPRKHGSSQRGHQGQHQQRRRDVDGNRAVARAARAGRRSRAAHGRRGPGGRPAARDRRPGVTADGAVAMMRRDRSSTDGLDDLLAPAIGWTGTRWTTIRHVRRAAMQRLRTRRGVRRRPHARSTPTSIAPSARPAAGACGCCR